MTPQQHPLADGYQPASLVELPPAFGSGGFSQHSAAGGFSPL
jgi:hypothetical protein